MEFRDQMVTGDIAGRGITDPAVLAAMRIVPRQEFVPARYRHDAHADRPLPIGDGQTISQPYIVAVMAQLAGLSGERLTPSRVLEIGTGSGYGAAVLQELADEVISIERHAGIAERAAATLSRLGYDKIEVISGDGTIGYPERAPYDAIVVTAAGPAAPPPLLDQLADGGRLVMPIGSESGRQQLVVYIRDQDEFVRRAHFGVRFVPLIGEHGFPP